MINIAICDEDEVYVREIDKNIKTLVDKYKNNISIYRFNCEEILLIEAEKILFDYVFLDVRFKENAFRIAQELVLTNCCMRLVFVSDYEEYVFESFSYNPFGFVRKSKLQHDMDEVIFLLDKQMADKMLTYEILVNKENISVCLDDVEYVDSKGNYLMFYMKNGQVYKTRMTVKHFMEDVNTLMFYRINAGCVINFKYLRKVENRRAFLNGGKDFSIGREVYPKFCTRYEKFLLNKE